MNFTKTTLLSLGVFCVLVIPAIVSANSVGGSTDEVVIPPAESTILRILHWFVTTVFGTLVGWFGTIFDYTIKEFVLEFGDNYKNTNIGAIIDKLWGTIRDIFNLSFIFGLVWIGFQMILGNNNNAQRSLGYLIAAALLVNFSLFITKFVVDFSNIAALQIYQTFSFEEKATIASHLLVLVGLGGAFSGEPFTNQGGFAYIIGLMMLLIVASFVFAAGAALITIRYIVLNLYLVFSPIMFLGWVFPGLANVSKDYWRGFLGKAFFAPAFIFMIYLSFQILSQYREFGSARDLGKTLDGGSAPSEVGETMAFFFLAMGFMIASLMVAQKMGANGATAAIAVGQRMRRGGQRMLTQPGRYVARNTVNKLGERAEQSFNRLQTRQPKSWVGRRVAAVARSTSLDETIRNAAKSAQGAKFGLATTVTDNRKRRDDISARVDTVASAAGLPELARLQEKERLANLQLKKARGETLTDDENSQLITHQSKTTDEIVALRQLADNGDVDAQRKWQEKSLEFEAQKLSRFEKLEQEKLDLVAKFHARTITNKEKERLANIPLMQAGDLSDEEVNNLRRLRKDKFNAQNGAWEAGDGEMNMRDTISDLTIKQFEQMSESEQIAIAGFLSTSQADKVGESAELSGKQKEAISQARRDAIQKIIDSSADAITKISTDQIETMGSGWIQRNAHHLTSGQMDDIKKSKKFTDLQKNKFQDNRKSTFTAMKTSPEALKPLFFFGNGKRRKASDVAQVGEDILTSEFAIPHLSVDILEAIVDKKSVGATGRKKIKEGIDSFTPTDPTSVDEKAKMTDWLHSVQGQRFTKSTVT